MMKYLFRRLLLFSLVPLAIIVLLLAGYIITDPLKVLYKYDTYSIAEVNLNRDYISTEALLNNHELYGYNSFILGSSHAMGYSPLSWKKHLYENASTFSYDAYSETLFGIYRKIVLIDSLHIPIDNALILLDTNEYFFHTTEINGSYLYIKHPLLLGNNWYDRIYFQLKHLGGYMNPRFFIPYYIYHFSGTDNKFAQSLISKRIIEIRYPENWMNSPSMENEIRTNPGYFETEQFYERSGNEQMQIKLIGKDQFNILESIHHILKKNNTNYRIIINPLYDQIKFNDEDVETLKQIFGSDSVFDFSGINQFTETKQNHYDRYHFRPQVGDSIMNGVYKY